MRRYFTSLLVVFIIVIHPLFAQIKPITLCPGAGTTLTVPNTPSHSYQWQIQQVDSFSFVNLSNTAVYSGTSNNTLSISNTITSMYGNKFRCLINDATGVVSGDTSALIFLSKWVGSSGTSWNTAANWDCGMVPDSITDAVIQSGNCIVNSNAFCRSLVLNPTATMQVLTGFSLTVANKATLNNELASNVRIVDSVVFKLNTDSAKLSQGIYEFSHATAAPTFSINEIIVGSTGEGYVRKITAANRQTNITILQTEQAGLDDIFKNGNFSFDLTTDSTGSQTTSQIKSNGNLTSTTDGYTFDLSGTTLFQEGISSITIPSGQITLNADWLLEMDYRNNQLNSFKMLGNNIGYTSTITLKADLAGSLNLINKQGFLKGFRKTKIVFVPVPSGPFVIPVPVVVTLRVVPKYVLTASTSQSLSREAVITSSRSVDLGISYLNNNWQTTYGINGTTSVSASGITAKVSAEINASITPQISVSIYGLGGPYASVGLISQAKGNINAGNNFLWDYEVGAFIRSEVGANARVLGKTVLNTSKSWQTDPIYYRTPDTMQIASGNNQEGAGDTYLTEPVKVKVLDNLGAPQSNVQVNFTVTSGSGSVESTSGLTDASGVAFTRWKLGANTTTEQKLQAYAQKANGAYLASPVDFTANFTQPYSVSATAGDYQLGAANQNLANPLEVLVKDINGNPMPNIKVEWSILKGAGIITNAITYTNATGKTTNTWKLGATGEQLVKVIVQKASGVNVAGSPLLFTADLPGMTVVAGGNNRGTALNQLNRPEGIYVDANENLYIADTYNNRLVKWDKGSSAGVVQVQQQGIPISIGTIKGVYVHADSLYFLTTGVSSDYVSRIKLGAADWANVNNWHSYFVGETVEDFTMDSDGWIYAPDQFDHTVRKYKGGRPYSGSGSYGLVVTVAGGSGSGSAANKLNQPWDVWLDSAGNSYITDALNYRIQKWAPGSTTGVTVAGGNGMGSNTNQFLSITACADNNGNVYVADKYNSRILKFAPGVTNGVVIAGGSSGSGLNQLREPYDIFLRGRYLYICDWDNDRVMRMRY